ncbi:MAG: DUF433 domain-containing protein [SAR202 cluster bacterium]|jgi:uncharacterized protein (DUF433 family)|nr:DUF433 domain-containing protein [SAR202 cluster bacterium]MDP6513741.1 DUF433 domain-containing protein [SAR202 cluster bacterium]MDP6714145.1 DUF433 domain-containing protein [SAR202 cluster bacterium]
MEWQDHIVANPAVMVGKPVIKGTRITVEFIIDLLSGDWSHEDILQSYPGITNEDVLACLAYAHDRIEGDRGLPVD